MKKIIAQKLKKLRNDLNYSTEYVSTELNKLGFSISPNTLYNYENGISQPKADMFLNLCKIYNVNSLDIFFNDINIEKNHNSYDDLNDIGKQKADEYIEDLKANQKYIQLLILIPLFLYQLIQRLRPIKIKIRQWTNHNYIYELWLVRKNK